MENKNIVSELSVREGGVCSQLLLLSLDYDVCVCRVCECVGWLSV